MQLSFEITITYKPKTIATCPKLHNHVSMQNFKMIKIRTVQKKIPTIFIFLNLDLHRLPRPKQSLNYGPYCKIDSHNILRNQIKVPSTTTTKETNAFLTKSPKKQLSIRTKSCRQFLSLILHQTLLRHNRKTRN